MRAKERGCFLAGISPVLSPDSAIVAATACWKCNIVSDCYYLYAIACILRRIAASAGFRCARS